MNKIPPSNIEIEQCVLGALMLESKSIYKVIGTLQVESFYNKDHQLIYDAIIKLYNSGTSIDILTVSNILKKKVDTVYIAELTTKIANACNIEYHSRIIIEKQIQRELQMLGYRLMESEEDINSIIELSKTTNEKIENLLNNAVGCQDIISSSEISIDEDLKYSEHFIYFKSKRNKMVGIMSAGNLSIIQGKAKSRKTFALTMLVPYIIKGNYDSYISAKKKRVCYIDTEQSRFHAQKIIKRINAISGDVTNIRLFALRQYTTEQRITTIENIIKNNYADIYFIDGVRDLVYDINDQKECTSIVNWLMMLTDKYQCHISGVIHQNKMDDKARGHLGTELINKSESIISVEKDNDYSIIKCKDTRGEEFEDIKFEIIEGIPRIVSIFKDSNSRIESNRIEVDPF